MPSKKRGKKEVADLVAGEKMSSPESKPNRVARKTREKIRNIKLRETFENSAVGRHILTSFGLENLEEILESENMLNPVAAMLGIVDQPSDFEPALAFFLLVAQKDPDFVKGCIAYSDFNPGLSSAICKKMRWNAAELIREASAPAEPPQFTEKQKSRQETPEGLETHEALVKELEKADVFKREVIEIVTCNIITSMADQNNPGKPIDWDSVRADMVDYSINNLIAFLEKKGIKVDPPKSISLDDIFSNPESLEMTINRLEWDHNNVDPRHFGAFVLMAAERNPGLVFKYFSSHLYAEIRDPETKKAVMKLLIEKGYPATQEMFEEPSGPPEIKWE